MSQRRFRLVAILVLAMSVLAAVPASADYNGGGSQPGPLSPDDVRKNAIKSEVAQRYYAWIRAGGTIANFPGGFTSLQVALNNGQPFAAAVNAPMVYPAPLYSHLLMGNYQAQQNSYYCGPASAWAALSWRGAGPNYQWGAPLTQDNLATWYWLNTTANGTPRGSNWPHTLNAWMTGSDAGWYTVANFGYADAADVAGKFATDIDSSYMPVMNVYMDGSPSRPYLPGWNSSYGAVYHYVPGYGYDQYGDFLDYIEVFGPVGIGYKNGTPKEQWAQILTNMGMIW